MRVAVGKEGMGHSRVSMKRKAQTTPRAGEVGFPNSLLRNQLDVKCEGSDKIEKLRQDG